MVILEFLKFQIKKQKISKNINKLREQINVFLNE